MKKIKKKVPISEPDAEEATAVEVADVDLRASHETVEELSTALPNDGAAPKILEWVLIPLEQIELNDWNPFEQADDTFNLLCEEIQAEGFDEPIKLTPIESGTSKIERDPETGWLVERGSKKYRIVDGEHRYKAARVLEMPLIPGVIKAHWDERTQKIETVRRNMIKGAVNPRKFTNLVEDIANRFGIGQEAIARKMGVFDQKQFGKWYIQQKKSNKIAAEKKKDSQKTVQAVENMTATLNEIFRKGGATVPNGYLVFAYKGQVHTMISMDGKLKRTMDAIAEFVRVADMNMNSFLHEAVEQKMLTTSLAANATRKVEMTEEGRAEAYALDEDETPAEIPDGESDDEETDETDNNEE